MEAACHAVAVARDEPSSDWPRAGGRTPVLVRPAAAVHTSALLLALISTVAHDTRPLALAATNVQQSAVRDDRMNASC